MSEQNNATGAKERAALLDQLRGACERRAATYDLLARLYRAEPDEACVEELRAMKFPARTGNAAADAGYRLIAGYLSNVWENTVTDLAIDYARCFIGNGMDAYAAAYPYESVYTSEKRLMMQDARDEVLALYRSEGVGKRASWKDGEDHIALELEFLEILARRTAQALEEGDEQEAQRLLAMQRSFLADHVAAWTPMMTLDMRKRAKSDLYRGLALLTDGFVAIDGEFLDEVLEEEAAEEEAAEGQAEDL